MSIRMKASSEYQLQLRYRDPFNGICKHLCYSWAQVFTVLYAPMSVRHCKCWVCQMGYHVLETPAMLSCPKRVALVNWAVAITGQLRALVLGYKLIHTLEVCLLPSMWSQFMRMNQCKWSVYIFDINKLMECLSYFLNHFSCLCKVTMQLTQRLCSTQ